MWCIVLPFRPVWMGDDSLNEEANSGRETENSYTCLANDCLVSVLWICFIKRAQWTDLISNERSELSWSESDRCVKRMKFRVKDAKNGTTSEIPVIIVWDVESKPTKEDKHTWAKYRWIRKRLEYMQIREDGITRHIRKKGCDTIAFLSFANHEQNHIKTLANIFYKRVNRNSTQLRQTSAESLERRVKASSVQLGCTTMNLALTCSAFITTLVHQMKLEEKYWNHKPEGQEITNSSNAWTLKTGMRTPTVVLEVLENFNPAV